MSDFWQQDYVHNLKARIKPTSWEKEIAPEDVDRMLDRMRADHMAPRTQQYAVGTLFRVWKHAAKRNMVKAGDNPAAGIQVAKVNNTRLLALSPRDLKDVLDTLAVIDPAAHDLTMFCAFNRPVF